jgi:hypothetical protein
MISRTQLRPKFARRINRRIDLSTQSFLGVAQPRNDFLKTRVTNDHQIDVAIGSLFLRGNRTINESRLNTIFQRRQGLAQDVAHAGRLQEQSPEFRKHRALAIRLIKHQIAKGFSNDQPRVAELLHFPLNSAVARPGLTNQLAEIEGFIRMPVEKRQDRGSRLAEQALGYVFEILCRTHNGYECT